MVLHRYPVEVLLCLPVEVHVPHLQGGVVAVVVSPDGEVPVGVRGSGNELVGLRRVHLRHLLPSRDQDQVVVAGLDEEVGVDDGVHGSRPPRLHPVAGLRAQPQVVLDYPAHAELLVEVVAEVGGDDGVDVPRLQLGHAVQHLPVGLGHQLLGHLPPVDVEAGDAPSDHGDPGQGRAP